MSEIKLQFVSQKDIGSTMIGWFSAGHLSHVDAVLPSGLLGARNDSTPISGVWERQPDYARFNRRVVMTITCTEAQTKAWLVFLRKQVGKPYDWRCILGFVSGRDWRETDSWICSELQAAALEAVGIVPPLYLTANKITPVALALAVSALHGVNIQEFS